MLNFRLSRAVDFYVRLSQVKLAYHHSPTFPRSSLVEGDEGCIGPSGKLMCLWQPPKYYAAHAWHHSILVWLLDQSGCSSPTKELHDLTHLISPPSTGASPGRLHRSSAIHDGPRISWKRRLEIFPAKARKRKDQLWQASAHLRRRKNVCLFCPYLCPVFLHPQSHRRAAELYTTTWHLGL